MWSPFSRSAALSLRASKTCGVNNAASDSVSRALPGLAGCAGPSRHRVTVFRRGYAETAAKTKPAATKAKKAAATTSRKTKTATATARKTTKSAAAAAKKKTKAAAKPKKKTKAAAAKKKKVVVRKKGPVISESVKKFRLVQRLRETALIKEEPKPLPNSGYKVFTHKVFQGTTVKSRDDFKAKVVDMVAEWNALSQDQLAELNATAEKNKAANDAAYKAWVSSCTPVEIADANRARTRLRRLGLSGRAIKDDRQPSRPLNAYAVFVKERMKNLPKEVDNLQAVRVYFGGISNAWKELSADEKKVYEDLSKAQTDQYAQDKMAVLGKDLIKNRVPKSATASA